MALLGPTLPGFIAFLRTVVGISAAVLPDNAAIIPIAYSVALQIVNPQLAAIACAVPGAPLPDNTPSIYTLAVYNLGTDNVINYAPDVQPPVPYAVADNDDQLPYFAYFRAKWKLLDFVAGVVQASGDDGTNVSLLVPDQLKDLTIANLQNLKTPYGRRYLGIAQSVGSLWGLT